MAVPPLVLCRQHVLLTSTAAKIDNERELQQRNEPVKLSTPVGLIDHKSSPWSSAWNSAFVTAPSASASILAFIPSTCPRWC
jgi:hypothetical protein